MRSLWICNVIRYRIFCLYYLIRGLLRIVPVKRMDAKKILLLRNCANIDVFLYNVTQCAFAICSRLRTIWFRQKRGPGSGNNTRGFLKLCLPTKGQKGRKKTSLEEGGRTKWSAINLQNSAKNTVSQKSSMASWQYHVTYSMLIHPILF